MFLHIGGDLVVAKEEILAIMDMESTSLSNITKEFLKTEQMRDNVVNVDMENLPKSYVLCETGGKTVLYISPIAASTLLKRAQMKEY